MSGAEVVLHTENQNDFTLNVGDVAHRENTDTDNSNLSNVCRAFRFTTHENQESGDTEQTSSKKSTLLVTPR